MKINCLVLGMLGTNCYILENNNEIIIIDPADQSDKIINFCNGKKVVEILVTHHHFDHIGALNDLEKYYNLKHNNFHSSNFNYEVIKTPGHTDDLVTFYFKKDKVMFCGDFIFNGSIGRYDFENSSIEDMKKSLDIISKYPDDIILYPGHGDKTILGNEKRHFKYYF